MANYCNIKVQFITFKKWWSSCTNALSFLLIKFLYSEKATKFWEISTVDFSYVVPVKSTVEISQNVLAFSEYMNFNLKFLYFQVIWQKLKTKLWRFYWTRLLIYLNQIMLVFKSIVWDHLQIVPTLIRNGIFTIHYSFLSLLSLP